MAILSKEDILNKSDLNTKVVEVPEWGGEVIVSTMSGFVRDKFEASLVGKAGGTNTQNIRARLAAACLVDEKGNLLFTEQEVVKLGNKSSAALDRIFDVAQKMNRIGDREIEELSKN